MRRTVVGQEGTYEEEATEMDLRMMPNGMLLMTANSNIEDEHCFNGLYQKTAVKVCLQVIELLLLLLLTLPNDRREGV